MTTPPTEPTPDIRSIFFTRKIIWLVPNDLVRFQVQKELLERAEESRDQTFGENFQPSLMTFSSLEGLLAAELSTPEVDDLIRSFILNDLAEPLAAVLWPKGPGQPGRADIKALAGDLSDGLDRLKLAGLSWDQVAALPPPTLSQPLAELGRRYDQILADMGRADRFDRRRQVLAGLKSGQPFKTLAGAEEIICRWSQRLSPFETDFIIALAHGRQVRLTLHTPAWVRDESIDHGSGFDLLRSIRQIEKSEEPTLWLDFAETADGPAAPPLAFAAEALLAPPSYRRYPPDLSGELRIVRTSSAYTEVEEAARRLKELLKISKAHNLALVVPDLDGYGPLIDDVGRRFGLAFHFRRGETLADQGPVRAVLDLLALWSSNWERSRLLDLLRNPYFRMTGMTPGALNRLTLTAGVTDNRAGGGFEENLAKMAGGQDWPGRAESAKKLAGLISKLKKAGQRLNAASDWATFITDFKRLLNDLGWPGDLNAPPPEIAGGDLAAAFAFKEELERLEQALRAPQAPAVSLGAFSLWLKSVLEERRLTYDRNPDGRIRVLNYYDLHGGIFDEIFFLGLNERVFPHIGPETGWWPDQFIRGTATILGRPLWNEAADTYRQQEQMLAAGIGQARRRVWLFHHAGDESGRAALPSPLLTAVKELWPDGSGGSLVGEEFLPWTVVRPLTQAAGEDEMWSALAKIPPEYWPEGLLRSAVMEDAWRELHRRWNQWRSMRRAAEPGPKAMAEWLEQIPRIERGSRRGPLVRPAFLAAFADCPMAFWLTELLKINGDDEPLEQWPTTSEGTLLHAVLEKFFRGRLGPDHSPGPPWPGQADFEACRVELLSLLDAELESLAANDPLGRLPLWHIRRNRLPEFLIGWLKREFEDSEDTCPWFLEWTFGDGGETPQSGPAWELPLNEREAVFFKGRVDRIDRTEGGVTVRDYKRRALPFTSFKMDDPPTRLWPVLVYSLAAASALGLSAEPVIEALDPAAKKHHLKGPSTDSSEIDAFPDRLADTWHSLIQGSFPPADDPEVCRYCPFALVCPKNDEAPES